LSIADKIKAFNHGGHGGAALHRGKESMGKEKALYGEARSSQRRAKKIMR
jgi:hypothetical protein